jgi:hypothetical protein
MECNRLIYIGYTGMMKCYLNISKDDAIERYIRENNISREDFDEYAIKIDYFDFDDEFCAYDVWSDKE